MKECTRWCLQRSFILTKTTFICPPHQLQLHSCSSQPTAASPTHEVKLELMSLALLLLLLPLFWRSVPWLPPKEISQRSLGLFPCSKERRFQQRKTELLSKKMVITWCLDKYCVTVIPAFITLIIHLIGSSDSANICVINRFCFRAPARWRVTSFRAGAAREQQRRPSSFCVACKRCRLKRPPTPVTPQVSEEPLCCRGQGFDTSLGLPREPACFHLCT